MDIHATVPISDDVSMDDARQIIYHEIHQYEQHILGLKSQLNTYYTFIARLPQDVLLYIFAMLTVDGTRQPDSTKCISVTHVCRQWRSIALGAPTLWTKLSSNNRPWIMTMLERSESTPLTVFMDHESDPVAVLIMKQLPRIRFLTIQDWSARELDNLHTLIRANSIAAPQLEVLSINNSGLSWSLPPTTFQQTDRLYNLFINRVRIDWNYLPLLRNLTELRAVHIQLGVQPTWKELINALDQIPTLRSLYLKGMLPTDPFNPALDTVSTYMPNLETVMLGNSTSMETVVTFLKLVKLSPAMKVFNIADPANGLNGQEFRIFFHVVNESLPGLCSRVKYVDISYEGRLFHDFGTYSIDCFVTLPEELYEKGTNAYFDTDPADFGLDLPDSAEVNSTIMFADAFKLLKLDHITDLRIGYLIGHSEVLAMLNQLPELQVIRVVREAIVHFLQALAVIQASARDGKTEASILAKLSEIHICRDYAMSNPHYRVVEDNTWEDFKIFLKQRRMVGVEVRKLYVRECYYILEETVEGLRTCVSELDWDGICKSNQEDKETEKDEDEKTEEDEEA